jgi:hypothetical protein
MDHFVFRRRGETFRRIRRINAVAALSIKRLAAIGEQRAQPPPN